eukprot:gene2264-2597_t
MRCATPRRRQRTKIKTESFLVVVKAINRFNVQTAYRNLYTLYNITAKLPIGSMNCEQTFSKLKYVNNRLQLTMGQERLDALVMINIKRDLTEAVSFNSVIHKFADTPLFAGCNSPVWFYVYCAYDECLSSQKEQAFSLGSTKLKNNADFEAKIEDKGQRKARRYWERPGHTSVWWLNFVQEVVVPEEWRENFRMSQDNFLNLCQELRPFLQKQQANMHIAISVEKQVAVFLYYISDEGMYRKVANAFGISRAAVSLIVRSVSKHVAVDLNI